MVIGLESLGARVNIKIIIGGQRCLLVYVRRSWNFFPDAFETFKEFSLTYIASTGLTVIGYVSLMESF